VAHSFDEYIRVFLLHMFIHAYIPELKVGAIFYQNTTSTHVKRFIKIQTRQTIWVHLP